MHSLDCRIWNDGGVLIVHVIGLLTLTAVNGLRELVLSNVSCRTGAVVLDLRKCVSAIDAEGWQQVARDSVLRIPVGIVCSEAEVDAAARFAGMTAELGFRRYVFDDLRESFEWAVDETA